MTNSAPLFLRHPNASRQAFIYCSFAGALLGGAIYGFIAISGWYRLMAIVLLLGGLLFGYAGVRIATLKVRIDERGVWEPDPFRLTYLTPWEDVRRAERVSTGARIPFVGVRIVHADRVKHDIEALKMQAGAAGAETTVEAWIDAINEARVRFRQTGK